MKQIGDTTFGVNRQALSVLEFLAGTEPDFAEYKDHDYQVEFETKTWYNGRECGFILTMRPNWPSEPCLNIAIFEHRNSDQICTLRWETELPYWNGPNADAEGVLEAAYHKGSKWDVAATFGYGEVGKCVEWIYKELGDFYQKHHKAVK